MRVRVRTGEEGASSRKARVEVACCDHSVTSKYMFVHVLCHTDFAFTVHV